MSLFSLPERSVPVKPFTVDYSARAIPEELRGDKHFEWFSANAVREAGTFKVEGTEITFHLMRQNGMPDLPWYLGYVILPSGERFIFLSDAIPNEFRPFMAWHEAKCRARELPNCEHACYAVMEQEFVLAGIHLRTEGLYDQYVIERTRHFEMLVEYMRKNADLYAAILPAAEYSLRTLLYWLAQAEINLHPV